MKVFAMDTSGKVIDLVFRNEDEVDSLFSGLFEGGSMKGMLTDNSGKRVEVDASYGYSRNRSDLEVVGGRFSRV